jgi:hypothetical protein
MRVYVAFTPYHILLLRALQIGAGDQDAALIFADEADILRHEPGFLEPLGALTTHHLLPFGRGSDIGACARARLNRVRMRKLLPQILPEPGEVFLFNSLRPETWLIDKWAPERTRIHYVEDGLDAYFPCNVWEIPALRRILHRWAFGGPHPNSLDMTRAFPYAAYHVIAPDLARTPEPRVVIEDEWLVRALSEFQPMVRISPDAPLVSDLLVLAHTERLSGPSAYLAQLEHSITAIRNRFPASVVAVKAHPRERNKAFLEYATKLSDVVFPSWLPAELIAPALRPDCRIFCGLSTFVVTSRSLLPNRTILLDHTSIDSEWLRRLQDWDPAIRASGLVCSFEPE